MAGLRPVRPYLSVPPVSFPKNTISKKPLLRKNILYDGSNKT